MCVFLLYFPFYMFFFLGIVHSSDDDEASSSYSPSNLKTISPLFFPPLSLGNFCGTCCTNTCFVLSCHQKHLQAPTGNYPRLSSYAPPSCQIATHQEIVTISCGEASSHVRSVCAFHIVSCYKNRIQLLKPFALPHFYCSGPPATSTLFQAFLHFLSECQNTSHRRECLL